MLTEKIFGHYGAVGRYSGSEPSSHNITTDPTGSKWADWIGYDQPGVGVIGAYEGAGYHETGLYRPSWDSKMRSLGKPFDAIAREQFIRRLYTYVDPIDSHTGNTVPLVNTPYLQW